MPKQDGKPLPAAFSTPADQRTDAGKQVSRPTSAHRAEAAAGAGIEPREAAAADQASRPAKPPSPQVSDTGSHDDGPAAAAENAGSACAPDWHSGPPVNQVLPAHPRSYCLQEGSVPATSWSALFAAKRPQSTKPPEDQVLASPAERHSVSDRTLDTQLLQQSDDAPAEDPSSACVEEAFEVVKQVGC